VDFSEIMGGRLPSLPCNEADGGASSLHYTPGNGATKVDDFNKLSMLSLWLHAVRGEE